MFEKFKLEEFYKMLEQKAVEELNEHLEALDLEVKQSLFNLKNDDVKVRFSGPDASLDEANVQVMLKTGIKVSELLEVIKKAVRAHYQDAYVKRTVERTLKKWQLAPSAVMKNEDI